MAHSREILLVPTPKKSALAAAAVAATLSTLIVPANPAAAADPIVTTPTGVVPGGVMQVVAHQDDDLFFMNPDLDRSIDAGLPSTTVYLTAGEITGDGASSEERARNRQRGAQNAYAYMAGAADSDDSTQAEWSGDVWKTNGKLLERYWLRSKPQVQLLFFDLHDSSLRQLRQTTEQETVLPAGGMVSTASKYTSTDVVATLTTIMETYRPTLLRTQDAEPDDSASSGMGSFRSDHPDHSTGAALARQAAAGYTGALFEAGYRDYNTSSSPANMAPEDTATKTAILKQYYRYDKGFESSHSGDPWLSRQYQRWLRGTGWATLDSAGRPTAFVVRSGQVQQYTQNAAGTWGAATPLTGAGGPLAPGLGIGRDAAGRLIVLGHRLSDHHVVVIRQVGTTGFPSAWTDLGSPTSLMSDGSQVGTPVVATDGDGRQVLFVCNAAGGVSTLSQNAAGTGWSSSWTDLPGTGVDDGLSAVTNAAGRIELFGSTGNRILHWRQSDTSAGSGMFGPTGGYQLDSTFPTTQSASPPKAILDANNRIQVAYLQPGTGSLRLLQQSQTDTTSWSTTPVDLGEVGGTVDPAMTLVPVGQNGRIMVFARNRSLGTSASVQGTTTKYGPWDDLGGIAFDQPAAIAATNGKAMVFTIGPAGVSVAQVATDGTTAVIGGWKQL